MSLPIPRETPRERNTVDDLHDLRLDGAAPVAAGPSVLDPTLVGKLLGELRALEEERGDLKRCADPFDRALAEVNLVSRSSTGATRALEEAQARGLLPDNPGLPGPAVKLDIDHGVIRVRGYAHYCEGAPCQDGYAFRTHAPSGSFFAVIADGVSSANLSHHAAAIMSDAVVRIAEELVTDPSGAYRENGSFMNHRFMHELHLRTTKAYLDLCEETAFHPADAAERFLASTLQLVVVTPEESAMLGLSDGIFRWGEGGHQEVSDVTFRPDPGYNTPPLLERVIVDEADRQLGRHFPSRDSDRDAHLLREAECFHVISYGATASVLPQIIEMATDGGQYTDMLSFRPGERFPLLRLAVDERRDFDEIEAAIEMSHLVKCGVEVARCRFGLASFGSVRGEAGMEDREEGEALREWVGRLSALELRDAATLVKDFIRSLPFGRAHGLETDSEPSVGEVRAAIDIFKKVIVFENFESFLQNRLERFVNAGLAVALDAASRSGEGEVVGRFEAALGEARARTAEGNALGAVDLAGVGRSLEGEAFLRLLLENPDEYLFLRREIVADLGASASKILKETLEVDAQALRVPVYDDLTWFVLGPRSLEGGGRA